MKSKSEIVKLINKPSASMFAKLNNKILPEEARALGESKRSTDGLTSDSNLMRLVMPSILGVSPDTVNVNWQERLFDHFAAMTVYIQHFLELEIGFQYDISDANREQFINALIKQAKDLHKITIDTDDSLCDYVETYIPSFQKVLYGSPINAEQYLIYRVAYLHPHVANSISEVDKSSKIRFYLYTDAEVLKAKQDRALLRRAIIKYQAILLENEAKLDIFLWAYSYRHPLQGISEMSALDKEEALTNIIANNETAFLSVMKDKDAAIKAKIQQYIMFGIFYKVATTDTITDNDDKTHVIGTNLDECIVYFATPENKSKLSEYEIKYQSKINIK